MIAFAFALVLATVPDQFDLVCTGSTAKLLSSKPNGIDPFKSELRIDMRASRWCGGECRRSYDIDGPVTSQSIVLAEGSDDQREQHIRIDRTTGRITNVTYFVSSGLKSGQDSEGECRLAPFKGMP